MLLAIALISMTTIAFDCWADKRGTTPTPGTPTQGSGPSTGSGNCSEEYRPYLGRPVAYDTCMSQCTNGSGTGSPPSGSSATSTAPGRAL